MSGRNRLGVPAERWTRLEYLWKIRTSYAAGVVRVPRQLSGAIGRELIGPSEELFVAAVFRDQHGEPVLAGAPALGALDPQHAQLADQVAEDGRAVAVASWCRHT